LDPSSPAGTIPFVLFIDGSLTVEETFPGYRWEFRWDPTHGAGFSTVLGVVPPGEQPTQLFGEHARCGRMVLEIAAKLGVVVSIVDVRRAGSQALLRQYQIDPDSDLPILVRPDSARLTGEEAFVPNAVERFLKYQ
jgi:hypothetical protein